MKVLLLKRFCCGLVLLAAAGCTQSNRAVSLDSVFWHQKAPEYRAVTRALFQSSKGQLDLALSQPGWTAAIEQEGMSPLPSQTAIILDVDETVLNNSPFFANQDKDPNYDMGAGWMKWINSANAKALDGAVDLIQYAVDRGVTVFFVSNRSCLQDSQTTKNMRQLGFPIDDPRVFLLSKNTRYGSHEKVYPCADLERNTKLLFEVDKPVFVSSKGRRRAAISSKYRTLLLFGDSQGDFYSLPPAPSDGAEEKARLLKAHLTPKERDTIQQKYGDRFGVSWMPLPNSMFGNWLFSFSDYQLLSADDQAKLDIEMLQAE